MSQLLVASTVVPPVRLPLSTDWDCRDISGVWCLVFGLWCLVFNVCCLASGVWCLVSGVWCLLSVVCVWCLVSGVWGGAPGAGGRVAQGGPRRTRGGQAAAGPEARGAGTAIMRVPLPTRARERGWALCTTYWGASTSPLLPCPLATCCPPQ